jgi:nucleoside-diphosphate-sugar epimerase
VDCNPPYGPDGTALQQENILSTSNTLIVGCGDIGIPLGLELAAEGHKVWGLRRSGQLPAPINTLNADVTNPDSLQCLAGLSFDYVVVTLTPGEFTDQRYQAVYVDGLSNVVNALNHHEAIKRLFFISSTSVYHQGSDQWVDETSMAEPKTFSGKRLLEAEQVAADSGIPYCVIRFAGIYGPGRNRLIEQVKALQGCPSSPPLFTNRIHRDDCVGILAHLIRMDRQQQTLANCYIGVDNEPVTMWDVKSWLAQQLNINPNTLDDSGVTRRSSKRCSNARLLATGYALRYSGYQQGYGELLTEEH